MYFYGNQQNQLIVEDYIDSKKGVIIHLGNIRHKNSGSWWDGKKNVVHEASVMKSEQVTSEFLLLMLQDQQFLRFSPFFQF